LYKKADVTNMKEVSRGVEETIEVFGRVDVLVNNAGGGMPPIPLEDFEQKYWNWAIDLNLKGTYICTQAVIKYMKKQQGGKIVNISSQAGRSKSELSNLAYASAKAGVLGFTRQLAHEVGQFGINVNAIAPGIIERMDRKGGWERVSEGERQKMLEAIPLRRLGKPEEIAQVAVFLASEKSNYITGATIDVNGGRFMM
jgi:NAD(P)-dependent dehydrogenase (short-subunit alcohol dehydrogenase family)